MGKDKDKGPAEHKAPSLEQMQMHTKYIRPRRKSFGTEDSSSSQEEDVVDIEAGEVDVHEYFKMQINLHKHEDILREEIIDESTLPRRERIKRGCINHARIFLAVFSQKIFLRHRSLLTTFVEVFFSPIMAFLIFSAFTHGISWDKALNEKRIAAGSAIRFKDIDAERLKQEFRNKYCDAGGRIFLLYYPDTTLVRKILSEMIDEFDIELHNRFQNMTEGSCEKKSSCAEKTGLIACSSEEELLELAMLHRKDRRKHREPIGLVFKYDGWDHDNHQQPVIPKTLSYTIRVFSPETENTFDDFPHVEPARSEAAVSPYVSNGFLGLQYAVEEAFLEIVDDAIRFELFRNANESGHGAKRSLLGEDVTRVLQEPDFEFSPKENVKAWPVRTFKMYYFPNFFGTTLRSLIVLVVTVTLLSSYGFFTYSIVKQVVAENQSGIKDLLKMHNMPMILHWFTLYIHTLVLRLITSVLITYCLFHDYGNGAIIEESNIQIIFAFIYIHQVNLSTFNFFMASLSNSIFFSGIMALVNGVAMYAVPSILEKIGLITFWPNLLLSLLLPNWAFLNGIRQVMHLECDDKGINGGDILKTFPGQFLSFFSVVMILCVSSMVYLVGAVYKDLTKQKTLTKSYKWYEFQKKRREKLLQMEDHEQMIADKIANREDEMQHKPEVYEDSAGPHHKIMVRVRNVSAFGGKHLAVLSHVSLNIHHGEITIILGHTGSGKSSLVHVMAGMRVPSHGYVTVHGYDVNYEKKQAHKYLGYCPQKDILFNLLNVEEHVVLCYRLRGLSVFEAKKHCVALLHLMRLSEVAHKLPHDLSKKDKRKLSISMGLVHAPKVMLLDEPTHGLDCLARREVWSILVELKNHHTIVIATNRMDEAEYLGDRIALLSHGRLICCGTPAFLKDQYDTGYLLKLYPAKDATLDTEKCVEIVQTHLNENPIINQGGEEILEEDDFIIELPKTKLHRFPKMLDEFDSNKDDLGLGHYTVAQIALDDIFIKICDAIATDDEAPDKAFRRACSDDRKAAFEGIDLPKDLKHETFTATKRNSAMALIHKRLAILKAKNDFFVWEYLFPLVCVALVCYQNITFINPIAAPPSREMSMKTYGDARVFYRIGATDISKKLNRDYKKRLAEGMERVGVPLLTTEQVLIKLEGLNAFKDGILRERHIVALEFRQLEKYESAGYRTPKVKNQYFQFVGYHSSGSLHSPPLVMNLITNVMLKSMFPDSKADHKIVMSSHPLPTNMVSNFVQHCSTSCVIFAVLASFGISFFAAGIIVVPIIERRTGMKHLQLMTGLHPVIHWGTEYLFDFFISFVFGCIIIALFGATALYANKPTWFMGLMAVAIIIILYMCWSSIPFVFFISTIIPGKFSGYATYLFLHAMIGILPIMMMEINSIETTRPSPPVVFFRNFLHIFPMYTFTSALHRWFEIDARTSLCLTVPTAVQQMCKLTPKHGDHNAAEREHLYRFIIQEDMEFAQCCDRVCRSKSLLGGNKCFKPPAFLDLSTESVDKPELWTHVIALLLQGLCYWGILIFIERGFLTTVVHTAVLKFIRAHGKDIKRYRPPDVTAERQICEEIINAETKPEDVAFICHDLTKSYATVMVVSDVSIAIRKGECIGILGGGGSGKSTLIKLFCGEVLATTGEVYIGESSIHHHTVEFLRQIGYCPQNSCLFELFNPEQMLQLMGRLRGLPAHELHRHVNQWLQIFGLVEVKRDRCKELTVGMRRCVCAAMAAIGGCEVIMMDEPTSGIDPVSRQKFWAIVKLLTSYGRTVIFTTYNVEECVYLSSRMIVLCEGNVQALGPPREVVKRFARGFTILIRVRHDVLTNIEVMSTTMGRVAKLKKAMKHKFKHLTLRDEQDNLLLYFLRDLRITWGDLFRKMEEIGEEHGEIIEKYYISEATLDEVFVLLTNKYREMDTPRQMEPLMAGTVSQKEAEKKALQRAMDKKKYFCI